MTLMLAEIDAGLDTEIFGGTDLTALREILDLPAEMRFAAVVTMGYPAQSANAPSRGASLFTKRRKPRAEIIRWERW